MKIQAACIQCDCPPAKALPQVEALLTTAARQGAELLLLPELWPTDGDPKLAAAKAEEVQEDACAMLKSVAEAHAVTIIGGTMAELRHGSRYNTSFAFGPRGQLLTKYRKAHLFPQKKHEERYFSPGTEFALFDYEKEAEDICVALAICFDLRFPEFFRNLALRGAQLFAVPVCWPATRREDYLLLCRARALENRAFLLAANAAAGKRKRGCSLIVSPQGEILAQAGEGEEILTATLDFEGVAKQKFLNPFAGRQPFLDEIDNNLL